MKRTYLTLLVLTALNSVAFLNLRVFPVFVDEAIHTWWIWRAMEFGEWLRPLQDGKPLESWPVIPLIWLGADTLTAMRSLHIIAGILVALFGYLLTARLASHRAAVTAAGLIAICPYVVHLERVALTEIYLSAGGMFALLATLNFLQTRTWAAALLLASSLAAAPFGKFPVGFILTIAPPLAVFGLPPAERKDALSPTMRRKWLVAYAPVLVLFGAVLVVAGVQISRGQPPGFGLSQILSKTTPASTTPAALANLPRLMESLTEQLTWPVVIIGAIGVGFSLWRGNGWRRWLTLMGLGPMASIVLVLSLWSSRYLLFTIPPLIICAVLGWEALLQRLSVGARRALGAAALVVSAGLMGRGSALLVFAPHSANWSGMDRGWPSGYGFPELAAYLQQADAPPTLYTLAVGAAMQLRVYLPESWADRVQQLQIVDGRYLTEAERRAYLLGQAEPIWLVTPMALEANDPLGPYARVITAFRKPASDVAVTLYEINRPQHP